MAQKTIKSERITLRLTAEQLQLIQGFGKPGDSLTAAHNNMLQAISGERQKEIKKEISGLEQRVRSLKKQIEESYATLRVMKETESVMGQVRNQIDGLKKRIEREVIVN